MNYPAPSLDSLRVDTAADTGRDLIDGHTGGSGAFYQPSPKRSPLTKQVNQLAYEIPNNKYVKNPWSYAPEFLKVFSDVRVPLGAKATFDCVLLGSPRPRVNWLFQDQRLTLDDVIVEDTADLCRITIPCVQPHHFGTYTVLCENEIGRAVTSATLYPYYDQYKH